MKRITKNKIDKIKRMHQEGHSTRYIAKTVGLKSNTSVVYWLNDDYKKRALKRRAKRYDKIRKNKWFWSSGGVRGTP